MTEARRAESSLGFAQEQPLHVEWVPGRRQRAEEEEEKEEEEEEEEEAQAQEQQASQQCYVNNTPGFVCVSVCAGSVPCVRACVLSGRWWGMIGVRTREDEAGRHRLDALPCRVWPECEWLLRAMELPKV